MTPMPEETDFMNVILGEVFRKLTNGGDPRMLGPNNFIAWETIASVIDPTAFDFAYKGFTGNAPKVEGMTDDDYASLRNEKKYSAYIHAEEFARLAEMIPSMIPEKDADGSRKFTIFSLDPDHTVSNVYSDILDFSVVKKSEIDPKVEKELEKKRKRLFVTKNLKIPILTARLPSMQKTIQNTFIILFLLQSISNIKSMKHCFMRLMKSSPNYRSGSVVMIRMPWQK